MQDELGALLGPRRQPRAAPAEFVRRRGRPARVADGQWSGGAPPHAGAPGGAVLPVLQQLLVLQPHAVVQLRPAPLPATATKTPLGIFPHTATDSGRTALRCSPYKVRSGSTPSTGRPPGAAWGSMTPEATRLSKLGGARSLSRVAVAARLQNLHAAKLLLPVAQQNVVVGPLSDEGLVE